MTTEIKGISIIMNERNMFLHQYPLPMRSSQITNNSYGGDDEEAPNKPKISKRTDKSSLNYYNYTIINDAQNHNVSFKKRKKKILAF